MRLIKIDAEGFELPILKGLDKFLPEIAMPAGHHL